MAPEIIRKEKVGKAELRLARSDRGYRGVIIADGKVACERTGDDADAVWRVLRNEVGKASPQYFGYDGARNRFVTLMAGGFSSPRYLAGERDYKIKARELLLERCSLESAEHAGSGQARDVARAYGKTNLLAPVEQARMFEILTGPSGPDFLRSAASFCLGDTAGGLFAMSRIMAAHGQPSWPAATFLPFLWQPQDHMFLKPAATRDFAERVGHRFQFDYSSQLEASVYASLLDLAAETERSISELEPRDRIDIQSFIWVVGRYKA